MNSHREDRRVQYTKMFLREALLELMKEKPIGKITPTELCRKADINRNTFYSHYVSPSDLLHEIESELYREILNCVSEVSTDPLKINDICRAIKEHKDLCSVIFSDYGDSDFLLNILASASNITISEWKRRAPKMKERALESLFIYASNGSVAVIKEWVKDGMKESPEEVALMLEKVNTAILGTIHDEK